MCDAMASTTRTPPRKEGDIVGSLLCPSDKYDIYCAVLVVDMEKREISIVQNLQNFEYLSVEGSCHWQ
jgi:hypothetical protein